MPEHPGSPWTSRMRAGTASPWRTMGWAWGRRMQRSALSGTPRPSCARPTTCWPSPQWVSGEKRWRALRALPASSCGRAVPKTSLASCASSKEARPNRPRPWPARSVHGWSSSACSSTCRPAATSSRATRWSCVTRLMNSSASPWPIPNVPFASATTGGSCSICPRGACASGSSGFSERNTTSAWCRWRSRPMWSSSRALWASLNSPAAPGGSSSSSSTADSSSTPPFMGR